MHQDWLRLALKTQVTPNVLEVAGQHRCRGVFRDGGPTGSSECLNLCGELLELRVTADEQRSPA